MTEQATPNEIQEQINVAEQQQQQPEEAAPTGTDTVAPPEAPAATSTSTSTSAPPRQSSRIQQQQQQSNNNNTNTNNNNASTSNNHDNQANQVTIDQIVHHTFQAGDNMGALNDLANEFDKIARNKDRQGNHSPFNQLMNDRSDPLAHLIPGQHTLTLLYILTDRIFQVKTEQEINYFLPFIAGFANACDSYQLSLAPNRIHYLADRLAGLAPGNPQVVFEPLYNLITTYTASMPDNLTSLHSILAYHMLWTGNYQLALGFIDKTFIDCDKNASPINHNHVLEYYYAAGMLNIKLGRLEEAEDSLEMCVTSPCQAATAIQIEAYKKLVLVQLLRKGKTSDLPKYVSTHVNRAIKNKAQIYTKLAQAYEHSEKTTKEVQELAQKDEPDYRNDHNVGLVIECLNLHVQRRIQRLARVYSCLSLNELSNLIGDDRSLNELADTLEQMTQKGWIICQIDASSPSGSPTVNFLNNEEKFNDVKSIEKIARLIKEGNEYNTIAVQRERKMSRSAAFLTKQGQPSRGGDSRFGGFMGGDDLDDFDDELLS